MPKHYTYHVVYTTSKTSCSCGCATVTLDQPIEDAEGIRFLMNHVRDINRLKPKVTVVITNLILLSVKEVAADA